MNDETAIAIYTGGDRPITDSVEMHYQNVIPSLEQSIEDWIVVIILHHTMLTREPYAISHTIESRTSCETIT